MLHILHLLERRFPGRTRWIATLLALVSGLTLLLGMGIYLAR